MSEHATYHATVRSLKKNNYFSVKRNKKLLKRILNKNPKILTETHPTFQDLQATKRVQVQTSKAREKEDYFFHLSVKCQNVILILPVLRKSKEDYQAIKPSSGSFVV